MAIVSNLNDDDEKDKQEGAAPQLGVQSNTVGQTGTAPGVPPQGAPDASKGTSSGRFNNIGNYIKANQNFNQAGGGLAGKVAGNIQGQVGQVKQQIGDAAGAFGQAANQNRVKYDDGLVKGALADPTKFAADGNNLNAFAAQRDAAYKGPQGLDNQAGLQAGAQNAQQLATNAGTEGGRFGLLKTMFNKPSYTGGQQKLDNLLMQGNKGQLKQLQATRGLAGQATNELQQQSNAAAAQAKDFTNEADQTKAATNAALTGEQSAQDKLIDDRVLELQGKYDADKTGITTGLQAGELSEDHLKTLGLDDGQQTFGLDLNSYLQTDARKANRANVANTDEYSRMNALAKLAGKDGNKDFYDETQAGKFGTDQFKFDKDRFMKDVGAKNATYQRENNDAIAESVTSRKALEDAYKSTGYANGSSLDPAAALAKGKWLSETMKQGATHSGPYDAMLAQLYDNYASKEAVRSNMNTKHNASNTIRKKV